MPKRKVRLWSNLVIINESLVCFAYCYQDKLCRLQNTAKQNEYHMLYVVLPQAMRLCYAPNMSLSDAQKWKDGVLGDSV